ncbi:MAG: hypothetical protein JNN27_20160 [Planctomycetes bacterium]|nr:hypothetical protein [Planctomycetota bacterium]
MEREAALLRAAETAFLAVFVGARIVERDVQLGSGLRWTWLAVLSDGALCAVAVQVRGRGALIWRSLDALAELEEHEGEVRRTLRLPPLSASSPAPQAVLIVEFAARAFARRLELVAAARVAGYRLLSLETRARSEVSLQAVSPRPRLERAGSQWQPNAQRRAGSEGIHVSKIDGIVERLRRLDSAVNVERANGATLVQVHGHELARLDQQGDACGAQVGPSDEVFTLETAADVERFLAASVERYLDLGCWTGAEGGAAALALGEPLLTREELAAFRELA